MLANYLKVIEAKFSVLGLNASVLDNKRLKYYLRSIKLNRPVCLSTKNIISVETIHKIVGCCDNCIWGPFLKLYFWLHFLVSSDYQISPLIHFPPLIYPGTLLLVTFSSPKNL